MDLATYVLTYLLTYLLTYSLQVATVIVRDTIGSMPIFAPLGSDVQMEVSICT